MFVVTLGMRFHKRQQYLCQNPRGEWYIAPSKEKAVRFETFEQAEAVEFHHRDIVQRATIRA